MRFCPGTSGGSELLPALAMPLAAATNLLALFCSWAASWGFSAGWVSGAGAGVEGPPHQGTSL
eukprot:2522395-Lingulodinium_polyedra.AAC.1